jgi:hypothetical protein
MSQRLGRAERWPLACRRATCPSSTDMERGKSTTMLRTLTLARRFTRYRALLLLPLALAAACDNTDTLDPSSSITPEESGVEILSVEPQVANASFAGGIPIGMAAQPVNAFGNRFNGGKRTISPNALLSDLAGIRSRGGRVVVMFAGHPRNYQDSDDHFSLTKWKSEVDEFKRINFSSYIQDGTIIGHYLMDEPNDPRNWGGKPVSPSTVEEMAKYSKQLWPSMATIVRTQPDYLNRDHRYLDAAWATYLYRRGNVNEYIKDMVSAAQSRGLQLVVGLNVLRGGNPNGSKMTSNEVESWGSALLASSYPCAFMMWEWNTTYLSSSGIPNAMDALRRKAENRGNKSCRS